MACKPTCPLSHLAVMLRHRISQKWAIERQLGELHPGQPTPRSPRVDCTCRRMGSFPHKAQRSSLPFTIAGSTCRFNPVEGKDYSFAKDKTTHSYCTTNRSGPAANAHVFLGRQWLLDTTPATPFARGAGLVFGAFAKHERRVKELSADRMDG